MPILDEIKYSHELGLRVKRQKYQWCSCIDCGRERWVKIIKNKPYHIRCHSCSNRITSRGQCKEKARYWKGGKRLQQGYNTYRLYSDDFLYPMMNGMGYVFEHRIVMAEYLGRCLKSDETIHHINGNITDNRIENLKLLSRSEHMKIHRRKQLEQEAR